MRVLLKYATCHPIRLPPSFTLFPLHPVILDVGVNICQARALQPYPTDSRNQWAFCCPPSPQCSFGGLRFLSISLLFFFFLFFFVHSCFCSTFLMPVKHENAFAVSHAPHSPGPHHQVSGLFGLGCPLTGPMNCSAMATADICWTVTNFSRYDYVDCALLFLMSIVMCGDGSRSCSWNLGKVSVMLDFIITNCTSACRMFFK